MRLLGCISLSGAALLPVVRRPCTAHRAGGGGSSGSVSKAPSNLLLPELCLPHGNGPFCDALAVLLALYLLEGNILFKFSQKHHTC